MAFLMRCSGALWCYMPRNTIGNIHKGPRRATFIKAWREFRGLTQREVVQPTGEDPWITEASLSRIEQGKQPYTSHTLNRLAAIYKCKTSDLLHRDPRGPEIVNDPLAEFMGLDPAEQRRALRLIRASKDT